MRCKWAYHQTVWSIKNCSMSVPTARPKRKKEVNVRRRYESSGRVLCCSGLYSKEAYTMFITSSATLVLSVFDLGREVVRRTVRVCA